MSLGVLFLLIGFILLLIYFLYSQWDNFTSRRRSKHELDLATQAALGMLKEKESTYEKEMTAEIENKIASVRNQAKEKIQQLNNEINQAKHEKEIKLAQTEEQFKERLEHYKKLDTAAQQDRETENYNKILQQQQKYNNEIEKLRQSFTIEKEKIENSFETFNEQMDAKRIALQEEINFYEEKQREIIKRFKADEEVRQKTEFYKLQISETDKEDILKLRKIAEQLHNPSVLYKLIWENYYKAPFSQLIGRIAPEHLKCGIYKITNLVDGRAYIGQTRQEFNARMRTHVRCGVKAETATKNKLYEAMWKDGPENFTYEVVETCEPEQLNEKEKYYIGFYQTNEYGLNSTKGNK